MGRIALKGMVFYTYHGAYPHEKEAGNHFEVDLQIELPFSKKALHDDELEGTVDYSTLYGLAKEILLAPPPKNLMESLAYTLAKRILNTFILVSSTRVSISKIAPTLGGLCDRATVEIELNRSEISNNE